MTSTALFRSLKGAVSIIAGGGGGLGSATAEMFAKHGSRVLVCDLPSSNGQTVAESLGEDSMFVPTDITKPSEIDNMINICKEQYGQIDNVVNCIGVLHTSRMCNFRNDLSMDMEIFENMVQVNLLGTMNLSSKCALVMKKNQKVDDCNGVIINISDIAAFYGQVSQVKLAATAGAIVSTTLPFARELANSNIRVNTVAVGHFSPLMDSIPKGAKKVLFWEIPFPKRFGRPEEFAHLCKSIIENRMINGAVIRLDGGHRPIF